VHTEVAELERLLADRPTRGPDDKPAGPNINVPRGLAYYWKWARGENGLCTSCTFRIGSEQLRTNLPPMP
jgi:hypothetical protein